MKDEKYSFWKFCSDNPIMVIIIMVILLGLVAIVMGYREGFASILTGIFGFLKKDDIDRKVELIEAENKAMERAVPESRARHDEEVEENVESAKAYCDELSIDELVDIGNTMLSEGDAGER